MRESSIVHCTAWRVFENRAKAGSKREEVTADWGK
jgi:hypothetical protein